jgi:hypothetical protein
VRCAQTHRNYAIIKKNDYFFKSIDKDFTIMKFFVPLKIEIENGSMNYLCLKGRKAKYFLHRDIEEVGPHFSSKVYQ